jgi:hypothetical protein
MKAKPRLALTLALLMGVQMLAAGAASAADEHERARPAEARPPERAEPRGAPARPAFDGRGQVLDSRYNHGRYYPPVGTVRPGLPGEYRPYYHGADRFYFNAGIWYAPRGSGYVVVRPPVGLVIGVLPPYYSTVWFGGIPYYYADNVYYTWQPDQNGYVVADAPPNADTPDTPAPPPDSAPSAPQMDLMIYPKNGQSKDQQAADQYECHSWAKGQTGFDPTQPAGNAPGNPDAARPDAARPDAARSNYNRAMSACLQARGYQVN